MSGNVFSGKKIFLVSAVLIVIVAGLFFLMRYLQKGSGADKDQVVYVTKVSDLTGMGISDGVVNRYGGVVESQETWSCNANSEYTVEKVLVEVGDEVTEGQPLFTYDMNNLENTLEQQQIDLERLKEELSSLKDMIAELEKESESAEGNQQANYTIQIKQQELERKQKEFDIEAKEKEIETTRENIANATVTSKISGIVLSINNPETKSEDAISQDSSFIKIIKTGELRVKGTVNEQNIGLLTEGMPVIVRSRVDDAKIWKGSITKIDRDNQQTNNYAAMYGADNGTSANYPFYVDLPSSEGLMMGQHVYLEPDYGQEEEEQSDGIWIDEWYVDESDDKNPFVWVDNGEGRLVKRNVRIGERDSDMGTVQVLSGLELSDLIAFPDENCRDGAVTEKASFEMDAGTDNGVVAEGGMGAGDGGFAEGDMGAGDGGFAEGDMGEGDGGFAEGGMDAGDGGTAEGEMDMGGDDMGAETDGYA